MNHRTSPSRLAIAVVIAGLLTAGMVSRSMARSHRDRDEASSSASGAEATVLEGLLQINQLPEDQLNEHNEPTYSLLKTIYDQDAPDFLILRKLVGQASVRSRLNPGTRCVVADIIAQRWDTFTISGNLYLAALKSPNEELRDKARRKLGYFIQPAHIPELIEMLALPGTNVAAYAVLQEVTGVHLDPSVKTWRTWWVRTRGKVDLTGHILKDTRDQLLRHPISAMDEDRFWYAPHDIQDVNRPLAKRSNREQDLIARWNEWAKNESGQYIDGWTAAKPILERITHQPDPRISAFLEKLVRNPGYGDYASVVLAWRGNRASLAALQLSYQELPTVGRMLARGSLGDKTALRDLLAYIEGHPSPLSLGIMDDDLKTAAQSLHSFGVIPAEQAFELLAHRAFGFNDAATRSAKKKSLEKGRKWLDQNYNLLSLDRRRGYYVVADL